jgi:hypothetical protein
VKRAELKKPSLAFCGRLNKQLTEAQKELQD